MEGANLELKEHGHFFVSQGSEADREVLEEAIDCLGCLGHACVSDEGCMCRKAEQLCLLVAQSDHFLKNRGVLGDTARIEACLKHAASLVHLEFPASAHDS